MGEILINYSYLYPILVKAGDCKRPPPPFSELVTVTSRSLSAAMARSSCKVGALGHLVESLDKVINNISVFRTNIWHVLLKRF